MVILIFYTKSQYAKSKKTFFKNQEDWLINGIGKLEEVKGVKVSLIEKDALKFHIQKGNLIFQKKRQSLI